MYKTNPLIDAEKNILNLGTYIIALQSHSWLKNHKQVLEFYMLLLSTLLGMFFMISAGNLLMFYLGLGIIQHSPGRHGKFRPGKKKVFRSCFKIHYLIRFFIGFVIIWHFPGLRLTGTLTFSELPPHLDYNPLLIFAFILLIAGFAFKISAVPFHLWTADVYEGAPVTVTSYLSVISKGSVLFVFATALYTVFKPLAYTWYNILFLLSVLTMVIGNLFAIRQNNLKRFLAFSSIAQVGFILIGITGASQAGTASVVYFILIYTFSNLGAFGVIGLVSAFTGKENIEDYKGFYKTNPVVILGAGDLFIFPGRHSSHCRLFREILSTDGRCGQGNYLLITIAALNMIVSLILLSQSSEGIFMDPNETPIEKLPIPLSPKLALIICMTGIVLTGLMSYIYEYIYSLSTVF